MVHRIISTVVFFPAKEIPPILCGHGPRHSPVMRWLYITCTGSTFCVELQRHGVLRRAWSLAPKRRFFITDDKASLAKQLDNNVERTASCRFGLSRLYGPRNLG
jgi:hypothetical protein